MRRSPRACGAEPGDSSFELDARGAGPGGQMPKRTGSAARGNAFALAMQTLGQGTLNLTTSFGRSLTQAGPLRPASLAAGRPPGEAVLSRAAADMACKHQVVLPLSPVARSCTSLAASGSFLDLQRWGGSPGAAADAARAPGRAWGWAAASPQQTARRPPSTRCTTYACRPWTTRTWWPAPLRRPAHRAARTAHARCCTRATARRLPACRPRCPGRRGQALGCPQSHPPLHAEVGPCPPGLACRTRNHTSLADSPAWAGAAHPGLAAGPPAGWRWAGWRSAPAEPCCCRGGVAGDGQHGRAAEWGRAAAHPAQAALAAQGLCGPCQPQCARGDQDGLAGLLRRGHVQRAPGRPGVCTGPCTQRSPRWQAALRAGILPALQDGRPPCPSMPACLPCTALTAIRLASGAMTHPWLYTQLAWRASIAPALPAPRVPTGRMAQVVGRMSNAKQLDGFPVQLEDVDRAIKEVSQRVGPAQCPVPLLALPGRAPTSLQQPAQHAPTRLQSCGTSVHAAAGPAPYGDASPHD